MRFASSSPTITSWRLPCRRELGVLPAVLRRHPTQVEGHLRHGTLPHEFLVDIGMHAVNLLDFRDLRADHLDLAFLELAQVELATILHVAQPFGVDTHA